MEKDKIIFKGSHPDSLYRVSPGGGVGAGKVSRVLRLLRWPTALILICVALAAFVYFLMPDNIDGDFESVNGTFRDTAAASVGAQTYKHPVRNAHKPEQKTKSKNTTTVKPKGSKTSEIDFYDAETVNSYETPRTNTDQPVTDSSDQNSKKKVQVSPVFPEHIAPEVQYGNEEADFDKPRISKQLNNITDHEESTLKPHITQKPEKPLAIFVKDSDGIISTTTINPEIITNSEKVNDLANLEKSVYNKKTERPVSTVQTPRHEEQAISGLNNENPVNLKARPKPNIPAELQEFYSQYPGVDSGRFTSGHSKLFGISIEDAAKIHSTTQSSTYNTRVSPTLPTWWNRQDSTTKKYPVNVHYDAPSCRSTRLAFCRGVLPYDLAGPTATLNGVELTTLMSHVEFLVSTNCSDRLRQFMCALLEPECNPSPLPPKMPCYNYCKAITDSCEGLIPHELAAAFNCNQYPATDCVAAKSPCSVREFRCADSSCIPRDWICDGSQDCRAGEDEQSCAVCNDNEFHCENSGCIQKRWMCDGYSDCPNGEDESDVVCENHRRHEPGEELAGSAPRPAIHKPQRTDKQQRLESDSSKELLMTSDSISGVRRNYTRRLPSLARLTPYNRAKPQDKIRQDPPSKDKVEKTEPPKKAVAQQDIADSTEANNPPEPDPPAPEPAVFGRAHTSPCPSGELRCVDGRCITLAQLCDGTIDCSDHADEDNCYT